MNRLTLAYLMDHLPTVVLQDPGWARAVHDHLAAAGAWWPAYVLPRWQPPVGFLTLGAAAAACGRDPVLAVEVLLCEAVDEGRLRLPLPWLLPGCPVVRLGARHAPAEEAARGRVGRITGDAAGS